MAFEESLIRKVEQLIMANETPHCKYRIVSDNPKEGDDCATSQCLSGCVVMIAVIPLLDLVWSLFLGWTIMSWISTIALCVLIIAALSLWFDYDKTSPRLREAERAKRFLGFDFGNDFTLKKTSLHDYAEILLDFDEASFAPLMEFCKSQEESSERVYNKKEKEIVVTEIKQYIENKEYRKETIRKVGFTKVEDYHDPSLSKPNNLWTKCRLKCEVDYENRTLKMFYVGF